MKVVETWHSQFELAEMKEHSALELLVTFIIRCQSKP